MHVIRLFAFNDPIGRPLRLRCNCSNSRFGSGSGSSSNGIGSSTAFLGRPLFLLVITSELTGGIGLEENLFIH